LSTPSKHGLGPAPSSWWAGSRRSGRMRRPQREGGVRDGLTLGSALPSPSRMSRKGSSSRVTPLAGTSFPPPRLSPTRGQFGSAPMMAPSPSLSRPSRFRIETGDYAPPMHLHHELATSASARQSIALGHLERRAVGSRLRRSRAFLPVIVAPQEGSGIVGGVVAASANAGSEWSETHRGRPRSLEALESGPVRPMGAAAGSPAPLAPGARPRPVVGSAGVGGPELPLGASLDTFVQRRREVASRRLAIPARRAQVHRVGGRAVAVRRARPPLAVVTHEKPP
jgi:hypothetical protein